MKGFLFSLFEEFSHVLISMVLYKLSNKTRSLKKGRGKNKPLEKFRKDFLHIRFLKSYSRSFANTTTSWRQAGISCLSSASTRVCACKCVRMSMCVLACVWKCLSVSISVCEWVCACVYLHVSEDGIFVKCPNLWEILFMGSWRCVCECLCVCL